ncbi:hypothetical protein QWZ04_23120 [Vibrio tapetis subsp. quintayensis]|uniref:hypothetical protein n=1 Tax=Vibrio tapetis TaxID=52443 RepID=UPI0025B510AC|nr:hypothetical protein [Vibrio tapetis]MDN3683202.1 hypothetical protein [Vibrio tapetis subsp. quintayensis]
MERQQGVLTLDIAIAIMFMAMLSVVVVSGIQVELSRGYSALTIKSNVHQILDESELHYHKQLIISRCMPQSGLSMSDLSFTPNDGLATYKVNYRQSSLIVTSPLGIEVEVTLNAGVRIGSWSFLKPNIRKETGELIFFRPLNVEVSDSANINPTTGCIK